MPLSHVFCNISYKTRAILIKFGTPLLFLNMLLKNIDHAVNETAVLETFIFKWCILDVNKLTFNNSAVVSCFQVYMSKILAGSDKLL